MSIVSAPEDLTFLHRHENDNILPEARVTARSVVGDWSVRNDPNKRKTKLSERGKVFFTEMKYKNRDLAYKQLRRQIDSIKELNDHPLSNVELLESERHKLDLLKDKFNEAQRAYDVVLATDTEKEQSYRWFDIRDREYIECRLRICEKIQAFDRASYRTKSVMSDAESRRSSGKSRSSKTSSRRSSALSVPQAIADAAAKTAKLKVEMEFLERENEFARMHLEKEIALANAEQQVLEKMVDEERKASEEKYDLDDTKDEKRFKTAATKLSSKASPYEPKYSIKSPKLPQDISNEEVDEVQNPLDLTDMKTALKEIVNLQKIVHLPIKEPPVFSGDPFDYPAFITAFDTLISSKVPSERDRIYFLDKYTEGKANAVVKGFLAMNSDKAYGEARKLLDSRYGNPVHVAESYKSRLRGWPQIRDGDSAGILDFSDFLVKAKTAMETMQSMSELDSTHTLMQISAKLPSYSGVKWCRHAHDRRAKSGKPASFSDFVQFVKQEAELANDPVFSPEALMKERRKNAGITKPNHHRDNYKNRVSNRPQSGQSFATSTNASVNAAYTRPTSAPTDQPCPLCNGRHDIAKCNAFVKSSLEERSDVIRKNRLCFRCFRSGHLSANCPSKSSCGECGKRHHTLLHGAKPKPRADKNSNSDTQSFRLDNTQPGISTSNSNSTVTESANTNASSSASIHSADKKPSITVTNSKIVPVTLHHKDNPEQEIKVYALLDDASDTTFVTEKVQKTLGIEGVETRLSLSTMLGREVINVSRIDGLIVERLDRGAKVELPKTYTRERIPSRKDQVPTPEIARRWPHLQRIQDKIERFDETLDIGLLIGCNCPKALKPKEVITGKSDDPYAVRTLLGWCIVGPVSVPAFSDSKTSMSSSSCHAIIAREVLPETGDSVSIVLQTQAKEIIQPSMINQMFELDFAEHKKTSLHNTSKEDRKFLQIAEKGIHHSDDGHYELPLPLKNKDVCLPNNRQMAFHRLGYLKKKFARNSSFRDDYVAFMSKVIDSGFAERVHEPSTSNNERVWYIPHHGVYHPKKPNKIRVVFDCAAQFKNESLNKHLLQGPDLTNSLVGVLHRFRQEPVAFTCDIEGMFHQVKVDEQDRDLLRFLWWDDGDTSQEPQEYRMTVHLFGATSSPGCANFALKQTANDYESEFGTATADLLRNNFYVDDGLKSVPTAEQAIKLVHNVKNMCDKGGFRLHKFVSNDKEVLKNIPEPDRADGIKALNLDLDSLPLERTLGVQWCVESDSFMFTIVLQDKPCTRRGILSTVSSVFDPIGFVAPLMLEGKSILQELCRQDLGWDDPIPADVKMRWEKWRTELIQLKSLLIPRCFKPKDFGRVVKAELHNFSDASTIGYGQCSYLRLVDENNKIHCAFVTGKSRVAPLKTVTIPRLELTAAVCSVRVSQQIHQQLEYTIDEDFYWTDSKVVLGYISNESRRFHVFVANRVQEIQENTRADQWRYIDTKQNPADEASRGMKAEELPNSRWILGPAFLWEKECKRSSSDTSNSSFELPPGDPEVKKSVAMATATTAMSKPSIIERLQQFSDWHRAKKAVALCIRYVKILKERVEKRRQLKPAQLIVDELDAAECVIVRAMQSDAFKEEIAELKKAKKEVPDERGSATVRQATVKSRSVLFKLNPFLDDDGLLRVGGRLRYASQADKIKFPVILSRKCHVTSLIVRHFHERVKHQGKGMTLNEIRSNGFWITGGSSAVSNMIVSCVKCQRLRGALQEQRMADLPKDRLESAPPFTSCGVDYFGPFTVKIGRKEVKRYGVLFTCMASRAIHLEVANSLDTASFINAYRRFVSRRGPIRQLRSDQGTNFVGARRELREALAEMKQDVIKTKLLKDNCDWVEFKMNVPSASHMGGAWERQIRTVRNVLSSLLQSNAAQLDDESLRTFMCEAEAIVNCRPLTVDQLADPQSPGALTPNHLLTMKSRVLLAPPGSFQSADLYCTRRWRRVQHLANEFWCRWRKEYLVSLQQRQKWTHPRRNLQVDDVVIIKDKDTPRNNWQLARVSTTYPSSDGLVRKVQVALADSCLDKDGKRRAPLRYLERPVQKLVLLMRAVQ